MTDVLCWWWIAWLFWHFLRYIIGLCGIWNNEWYIKLFFQSILFFTMLIIVFTAHWMHSKHHVLNSIKLSGHHGFEKINCIIYFLKFFQLQGWFESLLKILSLIYKKKINTINKWLILCHIEGRGISLISQSKLRSLGKY